MKVYLLGGSFHEAKLGLTQQLSNSLLDNYPGARTWILTMSGAIRIGNGTQP